MFFKNIKDAILLNMLVMILIINMMNFVALREKLNALEEEKVKVDV